MKVELSLIENPRFHNVQNYFGMVLVPPYQEKRPQKNNLNISPPKNIESGAIVFSPNIFKNHIMAICIIVYVCIYLRRILYIYKRERE